MGNYVSCTLSIAHNVNGSSRYSKIIIPNNNNEIRDIGPHVVAAAELMLEFPGHFLVNSRSLHIGRHFNALSADEELEGGNVYVMFPMRRLNSLVDAADVGPLLLASSSARGKVVVGGGATVVATTTQNKTEEIKDRRPMNMCGRSSRRPMLETIAEESSAVC